MRWSLALLVSAATLATSAAAAQPPIGGEEDSATVAAVPATRSARPVVLTLRLHYAMLCAQPGRGPVTVSFPRALRLPAAIPATAVLVQGKASPSLRIDGHVATVGLAPINKVICQSFVPGVLVIVFTRAARLGNPLRAGSYAIRAHVGEHDFVARLIVHR